MGQIISKKEEPPIEILESLNDTDYEKITNDWLNGYLKKQNHYKKTDRRGGKEDKGRDVIGSYDERFQDWDNYQYR